MPSPTSIGIDEDQRHADCRASDRNMLDNRAAVAAGLRRLCEQSRASARECTPHPRATLRDAPGCNRQVRRCPVGGATGVVAMANGVASHSHDEYDF
jgi:hypothetical protein